MKLWNITKETIKSTFYLVYQKRLERKSRHWHIPAHIGIILDGNRRFAREQGFANIAKGHDHGANKLEESLNWCRELGVKIVSIWVFSLDNFNREESEVVAILDVIERKMIELAHNKDLHDNQIKVRSMGRTELLPDSLQQAIHNAEEATKDYNQFILNVAVAYGGREEIVDAFRQHFLSELEEGKNIDSVIKELNVQKITPHLYTSDLPDPDLIVRTSGEIRLSGFLLWQSAYSEYYFCETYWPAFRKIDLLRAIRDFSSRKRRFGK